jgi:hypothetical protein
MSGPDWPGGGLEDRAAFFWAQIEVMRARQSPRLVFSQTKPRLEGAAAAPTRSGLAGAEDSCRLGRRAERVGIS